MASQTGREQRLAKADDVIENHQSLAYLDDAVKQLHENYLQLAIKKKNDESEISNS